MNDVHTTRHTDLRKSQRTGIKATHTTHNVPWRIVRLSRALYVSPSPYVPGDSRVLTSSPTSHRLSAWHNVHTKFNKNPYRDSVIKKAEFNLARKHEQFILYKPRKKKQNRNCFDNTDGISVVFIWYWSWNSFIHIKSTVIFFSPSWYSPQNVQHVATQLVHGRRGMSCRKANLSTIKTCLRQCHALEESYVAKQKRRKNTDVGVCFGTRRRPSVGLHTHLAVCMTHISYPKWRSQNISDGNKQPSRS